MNDQKLGQEPAFASSYDEFAGFDPTGNKEFVRVNNIGMSKRFYAACAAMQGLLSNHDLTDRLEQNGELFHDLVSDSYSIADELLKQETEH